MTTQPTSSFRIDDTLISQALDHPSSPDPSSIRDILAHARALEGLTPQQISALIRLSDPELIQELFDTARSVKETIYGKRLVIFAPFYISNLCANECSYCAFRARNTSLVRRALTQEEIIEETRALIQQGHKRVLLVAGETLPAEGLEYILKSIDTIYSVKEGPGEIRRINVNIAPLDTDQFRRLHEAKIGTYQLFQETYHRPTYQNVHLSGKKADYDWRLSAIDRAMEAGIDDCGVGILFGLYDWRYELLALMQHIDHLQNKFGVGPHTISVPRLEPASGSDLSAHPPFAVSDFDFRKIVAILRIAVPYTGIIMSTRETPNLRRESFALGVSQISAGSRTQPGGYTEGETEETGQFSLGDHRSLDEVIQDVTRMGYIPSFCTGCYRLGRTGGDFMDLARPGDIRHHCDPNAASTFQEYLEDYASEETRRIGVEALERFITQQEPAAAKRSRKLVEQVCHGKRDVYC
jgi:2-iminoacetate synthase